MLKPMANPRRAWIAPTIAALAVLAWRRVAFTDNDSHWMVIARDSSYTISLDTTRVAQVFDRGYEVFYRTDHSILRYYKEKAFNRETVKTEIACRDLAFKVVNTKMSVGAARPVAEQQNTVVEVQRQPWHRVDAGSTEADAARATCIVAESKFRAH
ncbi:MAG TPA: hypothetical protein VGM82_16305 [Gemmatimonadaceae bacterium]|jgi:hypothetical protein